MSREEVYSFVDRESLSCAKLGLPCRDVNFRKPCPRLWADENLLISGCRKPEVYLNLNASTARVTVMVSSRRSPGSEHGVGVMFDVGCSRTLLDHSCSTVLLPSLLALICVC